MTAVKFWVFRLLYDAELIRAWECGRQQVREANPSERMIRPDAQGHPLPQQGAAKWQLCLTSRSFESPKSSELVEVSLQHPQLPNICSLGSQILPELTVSPVW